jgi:3'-phosphoadenosine 5'-phosphosulfate (PAPS) 3'-phosphatase
VLDPIDGTRGFVGRRQYAVCLGMLQEGEVVLGVLGCPNLPLGTVTDEDGGAGERAWGQVVGCRDRQVRSSSQAAGEVQGEAGGEVQGLGQVVGGRWWG